MPSISVVIPCYNEEKVIINTVKKIKNFFDQQKIDFEIIIIDDNSTDHSLKLIKTLESDSIIVLHNDQNQGKGYSLRRGLQIAKKDFLLIFDADSSTPIEELNKLLVFTNEFPIVIGSRRTINSQIKISQPAWKSFLGRMGNKIIKNYLNLPFSDTQCGFKLFSREIKWLIDQCTINRWGFDIEILYLAQQHNIPIKEVGVEWFNDFNTKVKPLDYFKTLAEVIKIKRQHRQPNKNL